MNTLQAILTALTTPNEMLINLIAIPLTYLDAYQKKKNNLYFSIWYYWEYP